MTATGELDLRTALFETGAGFVITTDDASITENVDVVRAGSDEVDLRRAIGRLGDVCDRFAVVQAEGGARLNGALLDADLIDEIDVTTSPLAVGGGGPRLATDARDLTHRYELAQLVVDEQSFVFSRWRRARR